MNIEAVSQNVTDLGSSQQVNVNKPESDLSFSKSVEEALSTMNSVSLKDEQDAIDPAEFAEEITSLIMSFYADGGVIVDLQDAQAMADIILNSDAMLDLLSYNDVTLNDIFLANLNGGLVENNVMSAIEGMDFSQIIETINQEISADLNLDENISELITKIMGEIETHVNQNGENTKLSEANKLYDVVSQFRVEEKDSDNADNIIRTGQEDRIHTDKKTDHRSEVKSKTVSESKPVAGNEPIMGNVSQVQAAEITVARPIESAALAGSVLEVIETSLVNGKDSLFIQLKPDFLGGIAIKLSMSEEGVVAKIVASNETTQSLLAGQLNNMEAALREKGIDVARMEVLYNPLNQEGQRQNSNGGQEQGRRGYSRGFAVDEIDDDVNLQYLQLMGEEEQIETGVYNA